MVIKAKDITNVLHHAMMINFHRTGIPASDISTRSLRASGAMGMMCGNLDLNNIQMMGRWHSDSTMCYLHIHEQPIIGKYAAVMFTDGNYSFQPDKTAPIVDVCNDVI
jgi:hypothetical protein